MKYFFYAFLCVILFACKNNDETSNGKITGSYILELTSTDFIGNELGKMRIDSYLSSYTLDLCDGNNSIAQTSITNGKFFFFRRQKWRL